jgi:hypothetical protein
MGSKWKGTKNIAFSGGDSVTLSRNPNLPYLSGGFSLLNSKMTESQAENFISIIQKRCTEARMMLVNLWISQNQFNAFII